MDKLQEINQNGKRPIKKLVKISAWILAAMLTALVGMFGMLAVQYSPEFLWRAIRWMDSDVYDYQKFPERIMDKGEYSFQFVEAYADTQVQALFEQDPLVNGDFLDFLTNTKTQAFIVIQDDEIQYEKYLNGTERDSIVTSFSMAKSFTSALIGIAIEEGYIRSINDTITDYLPELLEHDARFKNITIQDLLQMSSGIRYVETGFVNGDDSLTYYAPDLRTLALKHTKISEKPGQYFVYNNYHPLLLGLILERATGESVADYLESRIWLQIGMAFDGSWSLDENGFEKMESGINARAVDFAKFGRLYLKQGNWEGSQVIPSDWVKESVEWNPKFDNPAYRAKSFGQDIYKIANGASYQYMWYVVDRKGGENDFFAAGNHGQYIYISPQANLIIVRHGETYGTEHLFDWNELFFNYASMILAER